ncbi:family 43 glycosylhydrolase [Pyxidicoccus fallax]|uniref:Family 43 glycosylhydrolase n=1 Tax=Pyxidicoccus fallax TaxID=394095 RepID=A0A848LQE2_9BACT|nr:family 43 glycosylhydrolase [Pyxidicoccus fallax]NMO19860.1 family 43 glycosylhydrolase [Pyxidicoccus fallax]NPC83090.1 family 43 glycosylhydrolase [Pyxidicoccus fallax]
MGTRYLALLLLTLCVAPPAPAASPKSPGTYTNPLKPRLPAGGVIESCADPMVLRGQEPGDAYWYMYCTTDPLNDADRDAEGKLVFRKIPQLRSLDAINWEYVGDAFQSVPAYAASNAGLWAPEVVYSSAHKKYYLFFAVTDTTATTCTTDSAIGVATSDKPTGPWKFSDAMVVGPRKDTSNQDPCAFFWTYDPDVLGDSVGTDSVLYYGSYSGGIFARKVTLTAEGATAGAEETRITIGNRYEGANVVSRDGHYYLFVSATNCCNGALTGYSVFAGRATQPLGPFVDREGHSLLDAQVGGTPVISMNGNRWVGPGHNTVFQDAAGQWWTIYHAVDRADPFFERATGFTKRPALLDPLDWVDGWPTVRGGAWASDGKQPGPAAREGGKSRYRPKLAQPHLPREPVAAASDLFDGDALGASWSWVRPPDASTYSVAEGALRLRVQKADLFLDNNTASLLTRPAPQGDYVIETRVRLDVPDEGCCFNHAQAGLVLYGDDDNYIKLMNTSMWETRQTEFSKELKPVPAGWGRYGNTVVGPPSKDWTYLRIAVERLTGEARRAAGGDTTAYTAYTSQNGTDWVRGGTWTHASPLPRIALVAMGGGGDFTAEFDYVRVHAPRAGKRTR